MLVYKGSPVALDELLYKPKNSLIKQSTHAKEMDEPLNGDGFGIGWYAHHLSSEPATFVSLNPAWSNRNLKSLASKIQTDCLVAHVRAASVGEVSETNCHPFQYKSLLMAHNGNVAQFAKIKREIRDSLCDEMYNWVKGQTDSEHLFAYFINKMLISNKSFTIETLAETLEQTFTELKTILKKNGIEEESYLNMVVTNGHFVLGSRYVTHGDKKSRTLYHSEGGRYIVKDGITELLDPEPDDQGVLVVSERLTDDGHWKMVPQNHFVMVYPDLKVRIKPINA
jgi:predicted glutamine amidotransferase